MENAYSQLLSIVSNEVAGQFSAIMTLEIIKDSILNSIDNTFDTVKIENDILIVEEYYGESDYKNDDDCCDIARENADNLIELYPQLELENYYCHRHKYAIAELKLK